MPQPEEHAGMLEGGPHTTKLASSLYFTKSGIVWIPTSRCSSVCVSGFPSIVIQSIAVCVEIHFEDF
jgi:hypothetical protein